MRIALAVSEVESDSHYHYFDNRVLPTPVTSKEQSIADNWYTAQHHRAAYSTNKCPITIQTHIILAQFNGLLQAELYKHSIHY
jgi:hypothetical protein